MTISLKPWNYYILLGSFLLLIIFGIITFVKAKPILRTVKKMKPEIEDMKPRIETLKGKAEDAASTAKGAMKNAAIFLLATAFMKSVRDDYEKNDEKGFKGYANSAKSVLKENKGMLTKAAGLLKTIAK